MRLYNKMTGLPITFHPTEILLREHRTICIEKIILINQIRLLMVDLANALVERNAEVELMQADLW